MVEHEGTWAIACGTGRDQNYEINYEASHFVVSSELGDPIEVLGWSH